MLTGSEKHDMLFSFVIGCTLCFLSPEKNLKMMLKQAIA